MSTPAIIMMVISMSVIWGGLIFWAWSLRFKNQPQTPKELEEYLNEDALPSNAKKQGVD
ncbi:methionine/alanine import family NSS transporter small subunit [Boudabousia liubingyangii]|uniref:methionine/alanine import family NSS transporter small subunit n=1 Tax=Boudabousia liubingyangii TaxID=1921764 RepID=UPI0009F88F4D|nr:methionine/alanine import family NSS transporter small subunit [Boudabousia liubingyangii]